MFIKWMFVCLSAIIVKNSFSQSASLTESFKKAATQKKAILVIVCNQNADVAISGDGENDRFLVADAEKKKMLEDEIRQDIPLKKAGVQEYLQANYIVIRLNPIDEDLKYLQKKYPSLIFWNSDYFVISSTGYILSNSIMLGNYDIYKRTDMLKTLSGLRNDDNRVREIINAIKPTASQKDLLEISNKLSQLNNGLSIELTQYVFKKATEKQKVDSSLYKNFFIFVSPGVNAVDSFYVLNYHKYSKTIPYSDYFHFLYRFVSKYERLFRDASYPDHLSGKTLLSFKSMADTADRYFPLALPFSLQRLELRRPFSEQMSFDQKTFDALLVDVNFFLSFNPDSVCKILYAKSISPNTSIKCYQYVDGFLLNYAQNLRSDIGRIKSFLFYKKIQSIHGHTRESLDKLEKTIKEKTDVFRNQLRPKP